MAIEIERKFLVERLPEEALEAGSSEEIRQGYLIRESDREVRIRRKGEQCYLTEKSGGGMARQEHEIRITDAMFDALWPLTAGSQLEKTRRTFDWQGQRLELDVYRGSLAPLMVLEAEFDTEADALAWSPPNFLGAEVTGDKRYKNAQLAESGMPSHG